MAIGGLLGALGTLLLLPLGADSAYTAIVLGLMLIGAGGGLSIPALTVAVVSGASRSQVGVAAATFTVGRQTGGILGVAVLGALVATARPCTDFTLRSRLPAPRSRCQVWPVPSSSPPVRGS